jgi:diguanylate cyclase (GGDEF)-like protein/PAS domain S-box-containing protein
MKPAGPPLRDAARRLRPRAAVADACDTAGEGSLLKRVADSVHGIEAVFCRSGRLCWISPSIERVSGWSQAACLAADDALALLVHPDDLAYCRRVVAQLLADGVAQDFELRLACRDGAVRWLQMHWWRWTDGERGYCLRLSAEDIQARKDTEYALLETVAELRRAQALQEHYLLRGSEERQRLSALLNLIRLGILFIDRDRRVLYCNRAALEIWCYPPGTNLVGTRDEVMLQTVLPLLEEGEAYLRHVETVVTAYQQQSEPHELHFRDGRIVTARSAVVEGRQPGQGLGRVWIYEDVTESRRVAAQLVSLAERDPLTNLYNRRRFHEELERFIAEAARRGVEVGLLMFDLDGFKPINDEFGHQAGDEVLIGLADGVGRLIRRNEMFFRLGGDEFGVLVQDADEHGLTELANRLMYGVAAQRFRFGGHGVGVTASIGIARFPTNARDGESLIAAADEAMYAAKGGGRNRWALSARQGGESAKMRPRDSDEPTSTED